MEYAGNISGNKPHMRKYGVDGGITINAGEPVLTGDAVADNGGMTVATTIAAVNFVGVAIADAVSTDAQAAGVNNVEMVSTIINPDAMWRAKMSGDAAEDAALLVASAAQAASANGLAVTGLVDDNIAWGYTGANAGLGTAGMRRATGAATLIVAMPYDIAALDTFLYAPLGVGSRSRYPQLTVNLTQIDIDDGTIDNDNANFIAVDFELRDASDEGMTNSYALLMSVDHAFGPSLI